MESKRNARDSGEPKELVELLKGYVRQETLDPLKGVGRFAAFGVGGSILIGFGLCLLALGGLRALQTETGSTFRGHLSWAPYLITMAGVIFFAVLSILAIRRTGLDRSSKR